MIRECLVSVEGVLRRGCEMIWKGVGPGAGMEAYAQIGQSYKLFLLKGPYEFPLIKIQILIYHFPSVPDISKLPADAKAAGSWQLKP